MKFSALEFNKVIGHNSFHVEKGRQSMGEYSFSSDYWMDEQID